MLCALALFVFSPQPSWEMGPFKRVDAANPVLAPMPYLSFVSPATGEKVAWAKDNVFNPAAAVRNGRLIVLFRAEDDSGQGIGFHTSRVGYASSLDGLKFQVRREPVLFPAKDDQKDFDWPGGCEDPRVVETPTGYLITYTSWNRKVARLSCATSSDLIHWKKHGPVFNKAQNGKYREIWSKSGSVVVRRQGDHLIAAKIGGKYWMMYGEGTIHAASSTNLVDWNPVVGSNGEPVDVLAPRPKLFDSDLAEAGAPSVITPKGVVLIYNGKNKVKGGNPNIPPGGYSAGQALLDPKDLTHVLARPETPFLTPQRPYETTGQYHGGTVFAEGLAHFKGKWWLYYGTADSKVAVATAPDR
jgi:predicted GH43/DUF377 family glycosyl hydrolase